MILHIFRKELLGHLLTLRFALGGICCLAMIATSAAVLTRQYETRLDAYRTSLSEYESRLREIEVYSQLGQAVRPEAHRPPSPLTVVSSGLETQLGDYFVLAHGYVPVKAESSSADNPYLAVFPAIDFVTVFKVLLSLLGLLFAYDAVAGEREDGTLRLLLSGSVSRATVLLGKYLGALAALALPLAISMGTGLIICISSDYLVFSAVDWARLAVLFLISMAYVSLFYLTGLLFSCAAERSSTALAFSLFTWVAAVLVYPGAATFCVDRLTSVASMDDVIRISEDLRKEARKDADEYARRVGVWNEEHGSRNLHKGIGPSSTSMWSTGDSKGFGETVKLRPRDPNAEAPQATLDYFRYQETRRIEVADRIAQIWKEYLSQNPLRHARMGRHFRRLSPAGVYESASMAVTGTGLEASQQFLQAARTYRREIIRYLVDGDLFGSSNWFIIGEGGIDASSVPRFQWRPESLRTSLRSAALDIALLMIAQALTFWIAFILFARRSAI